jgi:hypothetical protein
MDESSDGDGTDDSSPEATDEDVEAAVNGAESVGEPGAGEAPQRGPGGRDGTSPGAGTPPDDDPESGPEELPDEILNAPASAEEGDHTLLDEYERENEPRWRSLVRQGAFWVVATGAAVAVTLTAVVSLRQSGLSDGLAFILASVGMALMVGLVFLSLRR